MVGDFGWEHKGTKSGVDTVKAIIWSLSILDRYQRYYLPQ